MYVYFLNSNIILNFQEAFFEQLQKQSNNSNPNEPRCNNDKFVDVNARNFDVTPGGKYNRYVFVDQIHPVKNATKYELKHLSFTGMMAVHVHAHYLIIVTVFHV